MKKFYKTFLFLFSLNALLILPAGLLFSIRFLIPVSLFAFFLDIFLLFFMPAYVKKTYLFSVFPPDDPYKLCSAFKRLKTDHNLKNVQLLKLQGLDSVCFYLSSFNSSIIVLSENILESFSQKDITCFLSYAFQKIQSGDSLFLTVLSAFIFLWGKFFYILSYPFVFFKKKKTDRLEMALILKTLSFMTKSVFYNNDKKLLLKNKTAGRDQALFLWKLDSFITLNPPQLPVFLAPLFLTNFLTNSHEKDYISLQPLIKNRVENLVGSYPP
ncbi:MAG: hypothetical protein OXJ52_04015 [Oligoflexia bacterium]|nr:hypothetical protein [Oligoflexia bacterium]